MKILIIGGVAGGATTAARLRRNDENASIVIVERGEHISYANCGLPYYIGGTIAERESLFVQTPEAFSRRFNVDVRVLQEVVSISPQDKTVTIKRLTTGEEYIESYDRLVLSPGAEPVRPNLPGIDAKGIFTLRNVADTDRIKTYIEEHKIKRSIVVGAGFIGLEMAENLHKLGIFVSIVEMAEQVMTPLDYSMASLVHQHLKTKNVEFFLKDGVTSFRKENGGIAVTLRSGRVLQSDLVILSIGVRPDSQLAKNAGLQLGKTGGIKVNEYLQTSQPDIYAVGDAIEFPNPITKIPQITYLAGPANKQGRICADNITGNNRRKYQGAINTAIAKVFDITVASTGVSGRTLRACAIPYTSSITHSGSHAGYYPGAIPMSIKIVFDPESGKLFGAQIVGYDGVDKRIDLLATVIKNNGTIYDLTEIEHAYAPPYSSAKDPVNIAGFAAENIVTGRVKVCSWRDIEKTSQRDTLLVDVRTADEFALGTIHSAVNIPVDEIRERISEIPRDKRVIVFCGIGLRGYVACRILSQHGFGNVENLSGGIKTWEFAIQKQSNEDIYERDYVGLDDNIYQGTGAEKNPVAGQVAALQIDACGLQCPGPILKVKNSVAQVQPGQVIEVKATDPAFKSDVKAWANMTGNKLLEVAQLNGVITARLQKGSTSLKPALAGKVADNKTMVVFSDDLDKALASFVIANGAASTGKKVSLFFTFWGLNILKKTNKPAVQKDFMAAMFDKMLPKNSKGLKLSKLNMMGMGSNMMRNIMRKKNIDSLESLIAQAQENGVEFIACTMSMDVMGVKKEELIDGVQFGGVATYLERTEEANLNLFI
jgi:NADPH-dependent 2,4-dienoyl-CoA reductase/sulfur reductase-like enzyme/peroxiredoxin family protein/rhodanese-related sulfurtransferase/TusA-related sulfurtransferase